jgi:hypothetical protein
MSSCAQRRRGPSWVLLVAAACVVALLPSTARGAGTSACQSGGASTQTSGPAGAATPPPPSTAAPPAQDPPAPAPPGQDRATSAVPGGTESAAPVLGSDSTPTAAGTAPEAAGTSAAATPAARPAPGQPAAPSPGATTTRQPTSAATCSPSASPPAAQPAPGDPATASTGSPESTTAGSLPPDRTSPAPTSGSPEPSHPASSAGSASGPAPGPGGSTPARTVQGSTAPPPPPTPPVPRSSPQPELGPTLTEPVPAPPSGVSASASGTALTAGDRQTLTAARRQLQVLVGQLAVPVVGAPIFGTLVHQVRQLAVVALAGSPTTRQLHSRAKLGSLARQIRRLDRLLTDLCRLSPATEARVGPTVLALRVMWHRLSRQPTRADAQQATGALATATRLLDPSLPARLTFSVSATQRGYRAATISDAAAMDGSGVASPALGAVPARAGSAGQTRDRATRNMAADRQRDAQVSPEAPAMPVLSAGGSGSSGGAIATGGSGGAALLVTVFAVFLLNGLFGGRMAVDGATFRSALFGHRLERPG